MKMNNKGFSLVELIIVIAIMVVLGGVLAPQYMKHLKDAKVAADVANGDAIATAVNVAIASDELGPDTDGVKIDISGNGDITAAGITNLPTLPKSKVNEDYVWYVDYDLTNGVNKIYLGTTAAAVETNEIWPNGETYKDTNK